MKKIVSLLFSVLLLVTVAACGQEAVLSSTGLASASESGIESAPESNPEDTSHKPGAEKMSAMGGDASQAMPEMPTGPIPEMVRVRWHVGEFSAMMQLPKSGLDTFWEHVDDLFIEVDEPTENPPEEKRIIDPMVSSPYVSGQAALLEDIMTIGFDVPQKFYWVNEETVRALWEDVEYLSATCQDRVAHFDFESQNEDGMWGEFDLFVAMSPEAQPPEEWGYLRYRHTPDGEWEASLDHPGFELLQMTTELVISTQGKYHDYLEAWGNPVSSGGYDEEEILAVPSEPMPDENE